jgi:FkbM family methyltransferase
MISVVAKVFGRIRIQIEDIVWHKSVSSTIIIFLNILNRRRLPMPAAVYDHFMKIDETSNADDFGDEAFLANYMIPEEGKCLIDVGAATGLWTLFAAKRGRQVYAFEPSPKSFIVLKNRSVKYSNVHAYPYALGDKDSVGRLGLAAFSLSGIMDAEVKGLHKGGTINITVRSLDSLAISEVGIIKIDTEGYEIPILHGAKETIIKYKPRLIVEVHRDSGKAAKTFIEELQRIDEILTEYGYTWIQHNRQISLRDWQPHLIAECKLERTP